MTALLERVKFLGGNGGEAPELDTTATDDTEQYDPDPAPGTKARRATGATARKSAASAKTASTQKRTAGKFVAKGAVQEQITAEIEMLVKGLAFLWSMSDEHCAGVLNDTSAAIARDWAAVAGRSEWLVEKITTTSLMADLMKAMISTAPVIKALYVHHIAAKPDEGEEFDRVTVADEGLDGYAPWRPAVVAG